MLLKRKIIAVAAILLIGVSLVAAILWAGLGIGQEETKLFTYPFSVEDKTFIITVETNWNEEREPSVSLLDSSDSRHAVELYFLGGTEEKIVTYNITIPTDLLWGDISLIRKYYPVDSDDYTLISNGTHNCLQLTFDYKPFFSGNGYFEIVGTEGAW